MEALNFVINGISFGMILFLLAAGLTVALSMMRILNLAHGALYLFSAYVGVSIAKWTGNFGLTVLVGLLASTIIGLAMYRILLDKEFARGESAQVLLTFGVLLFFSGLDLYVWGGLPLTIPKPSFFTGSVSVGPITYPTYRILVIAAGIAIALGLWWFQARTKYGAIVRAAVDDEQMAAGIGINVKFVKLLMFGLGASLAGIAGVLSAPIIAVQPGFDVWVLFLVVAVIALGGIGSLLGAFVGALLIGLADSFGKALFPELAMFTIFAPMAIILAIRPTGLFGKQV